MLILTDEQQAAVLAGCPKQCGSTCFRYIVTFTNIVVVDDKNIIDVHEGEDGTITGIDCDDCDAAIWEAKT